MLTCIARSKQATDDQSPSIDHSNQPAGIINSNAAPTKQAIKTLSSQIKDMALKASGAYRNCAPCANQAPAAEAVQHRRNVVYGSGESESTASEKFRWSYRRTGSSNSSSTAGRRELEARLKGISSGEGTPASASGRRVDPVVFVEESEPKEWVAQVEPGVLITFVSLPRGGNDLKRIRFSREMFNKWEAQRWWAENSEKVMELYNVQRLNLLPRSEDDNISSKIEDSPVTPPLGREHRPIGIGYSDSLSSISISGTAKTEISSGEISISNAASDDLESEWVEQDEPGVYITIRALPHGRRELRRVRFSREKFGELHARVWWEESRARIHKQYL